MRGRTSERDKYLDKLWETADREAARDREERKRIDAGLQKIYGDEYDPDGFSTN